jgi:hypothetical protein
MRGPRAESAHYDARRNRVIIRLTTGVEIGFALGDVKGLQRVSTADLRLIEVEAFGLGIHFPAINADLHVPAFRATSRRAGGDQARRMITLSPRQVTLNCHSRQVGGRPLRNSQRDRAGYGGGGARYHRIASLAGLPQRPIGAHEAILALNFGSECRASAVSEASNARAPVTLWKLAAVAGRHFGLRPWRMTRAPASARPCSMVLRRPRELPVTKAMRSIREQLG